MKLTKEDLGMLPPWVGQNSRTVSFFEWLMEEGLSPWKCGDTFIVKVKQRKNYFLYISPAKGCVLDMEKDMVFAGFFREKDCGLYDLKRPLWRLLGIPDRFCFPEKADALKEAQEIANRKAILFAGRDWNQILAVTQYEKEQMIPKITRSEIRNCAEKYYQAGKTEEEICFRPQVPVARYFSDHCYLLYLDQKEWVAEKIARQWAVEHAAYISRQRIWYGCIRNEYREVKKEAEKKRLR